MGLKISTRLAVAASAAVAALAAAPAAGAVVYTPAQDAGVGIDGATDVLQDPHGGAWIATYDEHSVQIRQRVQGGGLEPPIVLGTGDLLFNAAAAIDAQGTITAAWTDTAGLHARSRTADGTLGPVFTDPAGAGDDLTLAASPAGAVAVGYRVAENAEVATRAPGQPFGSPVAIPNPTGVAGIYGLQVADDGTAFAAYRRPASQINTSGRIWLAAVAPGHAPLTTLVSNPDTSDHSADQAAVALSASGHVHVVWTEEEGSPTRSVLKTATYDSGLAIVGSRQTISTGTPGADAQTVSAAAGPGDRWEVAWDELTPGTATVYAREFSGTTAGDLQTVATDAGIPELRWSPSPSPLLGLSVTGADGNPQAAVSERAADGSWPVDRVAPPNTFMSVPTVAADVHGNVTAAWTGIDDRHLIWALGDNDGPPRISGLSGPATATVGQALPFSAQVEDFLPVATRWDFGDGTASGTSAQHAYATTGTRSVTLTATDAVGQATTRTLTTSVVAPPKRVPDTKIASPAKRRAKRVRTIAGTATEPGGKVVRVEVSIVRVGAKHGARTHLSGRAKGTTKWRLALKHRLRGGTYRITAYAIDAAGVKDPTPARRTVRVG